MAINSLLNPRSIAIVGASDKVGPGFNAWKALEHLGYEGSIYLVNPNKSEMFGQKTYPSLSAIDADVDAAFLAVRADSILEVVNEAVAKRVGGLAVLSSGFADAGESGLRIQQELTMLAEANGIAVCGPNCLGLLNFASRSALFGTSLPDYIKPGGIAAIVQSGSIGIALLNSGRRLGLSHLVTSGNEAVTATADYLEAFNEDPGVHTVIVFAEQIRKPEKFIKMVERATILGKPVIVLKSGRSARAQAAVMAHTGAVAGSVEACDAALKASGAIQVHTLDELIEVAVLISELSRKPTAGKIAAVSLSGGEIALALDAAENSGADFAALGFAEAQIKPLLPEFANLANPLDLTWAGLYDSNVATGCARALASLEEVGSLVLLQDAPAGLGPQQAGRYSSLLRAVATGANEAGKPLIALSNLSDELHADLRDTAKELNVPYLRGTHEGLSAIAKYAEWITRPKPSQIRSTPRHIQDIATELLSEFKNERVPAEHEAREILRSYGIVGPRERFVGTPAEAAEASTEIGFPVVLKCLVAGMLHKSDVGLVRLRLGSADAVRDAAQSMLQTAAHLGGKPVLGLLVQSMVSSVAEILVGARVDPDFGPLIVVGSGGVNVELYRDVAIRIAPITEREAVSALESTAVGRLLDGWRGGAVGDKAAAGKVISAVSHFIADFASEVHEVELNPLAILEEGRGCLALDCVIVPRLLQEANASPSDELIKGLTQ